VKRLVLLHGFSGSPSSFETLERELRLRGARIFCPALLGHGATGPSWAPRFEEEVDRLASAIGRAGFAGAQLCGYSLGARVALGLLARHPFLFRGVTLVSVHPGLGSHEERASRVGSDERWCELLTRGGTRAFSRAWEAQPLFATQTRLPLGIKERQREIRRAHSADGLARSLRALGLGQMPDYRGVLQRPSIPVELVAGALDDKFVALAHGLSRNNPRLSLELVPDAGHNVLLEAPNALVRVLTRTLHP